MTRAAFCNTSIVFVIVSLSSAMLGGWGKRSEIHF